VKYRGLAWVMVVGLAAGCGSSPDADDDCPGADCEMDAGADAGPPPPPVDGGPVEDTGPPPEDGGPPPPIDAGPCDAPPPFELGEPIDAPSMEWTFVEFPDSRCANDTPTGIGVNLNPASDDVVIYMEGGGACFDLVTCISVAHSGGFGESDLDAVADRFGDRGIFARDDADNPVADWNMVFVPYCTGDVHAGRNPDSYGGRNAHGYDNVTEYLKRLVPTFADANQVLLTGSSAGGFGSAWNFDQVQRGFGCTPVTLLDDAGPPMADDYMKPCLQSWWRDTWGLDDTLPADCPECAGSDGGGLVNLAPYLARKYPDRRFGLLSTMEDNVIRGFFGYGYSASCMSPSSMRASEFRAGLEDLRDRVLGSHDNFHTFYAEGDSHTFLGQPLGSIEVDGVTLGDWIGQLLDDAGSWNDVGP